LRSKRSRAFGPRPRRMAPRSRLCAYTHCGLTLSRRATSATVSRSVSLASWSVVADAPSSNTRLATASMTSGCIHDSSATSTLDRPDAAPASLLGSGGCPLGACLTIVEVQRRAVQVPLGNRSASPRTARRRGLTCEAPLLPGGKKVAAGHGSLDHGYASGSAARIHRSSGIAGVVSWRCLIMAIAWSTRSRSSPSSSASRSLSDTPCPRP
jgi:hypothetical protein